MTTQSDLSVAWSQSHKLDTAKISFLDLPRELRDLIYAYTFHVPGAIFLDQSVDIVRSGPLRTSPVTLDVRSKAMNVRYRNHGPAETQSLSQAGVTTALLRSCRQVHSEACPVFYSDNIFRIVLLPEGAHNLALPYRLLVRRVVIHDTFVASNTGHRVFGSPHLHAASYVWKLWFWPRVSVQSGKMLDQFPNMESFTVPVKVAERDADWVPVYFKLGGKTAEERVERAAQWMLERSPLGDERLRDCLHLELEAPPGKIWKEEYAGSRFAPDEEEWDYKEFEDAFELMKTL
ncbi:hypothetical protein G6514_006916 [Epicoccum nigrum]|nr:hypothetical protein G6514_006916 [Epicoccum nigrum]